MAKINVAFDTDSKELSATIDGTAVENVVGVEMYPSWDEPAEFRCAIVTRSEDQATKIKTITQLIAGKTEQGRAVAPKGDVSIKFPGFVEVRDTTDSKAHQDIAKFFEVE